MIVGNGYKITSLTTARTDFLKNATIFTYVFTRPQFFRHKNSFYLSKLKNKYDKKHTLYINNNINCLVFFNFSVEFLQ